MARVINSEMTAMDVFAWGKKQKNGFTTGQVTANFEIPKTRAAAFLAILRIKELIASKGKGSDGTSFWVTT